ncbi:A-kinase anchor protein 13 isoform X4 [Xenopus laevis]|uniref:A-kinase anchor protein 13 isoform X4 n=1 Tax=Xenopus laevis TaxID=8355 RepID=A0A8J1MMZ0_XENLA|nr:A-kinase anchor protein 13 isoform X4 [Xenopus laevis]
MRVSTILCFLLADTGSVFFWISGLWRASGTLCWGCSTSGTHLLDKEEGDCVLTVQLTQESELVDDVVFFLLFVGSTSKHLTSTRKVNSATLETITPGHDCCERVKVSLCASKKDCSVVVAEEDFEFIQDEAYDSAQFLAANAGNQQALIFARFLERSRPSTGDATVLDERITLAFQHLSLPSGWSVLGTDTCIKDGHLQETLMHFAARLGLCQLSQFLLKQPGGKTALAIYNSEGATPLSLALERGFLKLHHLFTEEQTDDPDSVEPHVDFSEDTCVKHHCRLNVFTLTKSSQVEPHISMEHHIEELKEYMQNHSQSKGTEEIAECQALTEESDSSCCPHHNTASSAAEKDLPSGATHQGDLENTGGAAMLSLNVLSEIMEESCAKSDNGVDPVGGEVAVFSSESKKDTEEEEVVPESIVEAENLSVTGDHVKGSCTEVHAAELPLSCGNSNEETGITSTELGSEQESVLEGDNTEQEMITVKEGTVANSEITEATHEFSNITNHNIVEMGQTVSGYCTSNANTMEMHSGSESSELETGPRDPLVNLPADSISVGHICGTNICSCSVAPAELVPKQNAAINSELDCKGTSEDTGINEISECCDADKSTENEIPAETKDSPCNLVQPSTEIAFCDPTASEPLTWQSESEQCKKSSVVRTEDEKQESSETEPLGDRLTQLANCDMDSHSQGIEKAINDMSPSDKEKEGSLNSDIPCSNCPEEALSPELSSCQIEEKSAEGDPSIAACPNTNSQSMSPLGLPVSEQQLPTLIQLHAELIVAEILQEIIEKLDTTSLLTQTAQQQTDCLQEETKLPPAGHSASVQEEEDQSVCTGECNKVFDTPSLLSNYDSLQKQEVLAAEDTLNSNANTEMQKTTPACKQSREQLQVNTGVEDQAEPEPNVMLCETFKDGGQDETLPISDVFQCDTDWGNELPLQCCDCTESLAAEIEENTTLCNTVDLKESTDKECVSESTEETGVKMTFVNPSDNVLESETCLATSEKEEPRGVDSKESLPAYDKDGEDSELVTITRVCLHPIAEESLLNGDSASDTASTSSESEESLHSDDLEKLLTSDAKEVETAQQILNSNYHTDIPLSEEVHINVYSLEGPNGAVDVECEACIVSGLLETESVNGLSTDAPQDKENSVQDSEVTDSLKEDDSGFDLSITMEETTYPSISDTEILPEGVDGQAEDEVDFIKPLQTSSEAQMINREVCCSIEPCSHSDLLESKQPKVCNSSSGFLEDGLCIEDPSQEKNKRDSASESDMFQVSSEALDEMVFPKNEESPCLCDASSSSSSTDDTASLERNSSHGSDISLPQTKKFRDRLSLDSSCSSTVTASVEEREIENTGISEMEGEEMDSITEVSQHPSRSKSSMRSLSPFRRHSWEPGKHAANDSEINRRSSFRVLGDVKKPSVHRRSMSWCPSDAKLSPMRGDFNYRSYSLEGLAGENEDTNPSAAHDHTSSDGSNLIGSSSYERENSGSLASLTEDEPGFHQRPNRKFLQRQECERSYIHGFGPPPASHLTKSMSLTAISHNLTETQGRIRPKRRISFSFNISPLLPKSKHVFSIGSSSSDDESDSSRSVNITSGSIAQRQLTPLHKLCRHPDRYILFVKLEHSYNEEQLPGCSISEEGCNQLPPSPSRKDLEGKSETRVSRTFSYIRSKMSSGKKSKEKEKDRDKTKEKDRDPKEKEKDKKTVNGHQFSATPIVGPIPCNNCMKTFSNKDGYLCANCHSIVHKGCRESYTACAKVKMKQQKTLQPHDTSSLPVVMMRPKGSQIKERPRSAILAPEDNNFSALIGTRRSQNLSISKSISTQNIAGVGKDESLLGSWKYLSQSTDSLHKISKVHESTESLIDEGTDMNEGQLMGEFEMDSRQLEAESWSQAVDSKCVRQQKKDVVKRQDVIYELMQTEMHHVRTLKIMSDVYSRGMGTELQMEQQVLDKIFPCLENLLNIHSQFFQRILERKKESLIEKSEKNFVIKRIGDILVDQFSGENGERMKKIYGKFCGHHNEAVNYFKDLLSKEKRFQAFIKKKMSSSVVRRLGIPECILLVTQRITKYPVLLQRILENTKENEAEHQDVLHSLNLVKDVITAVNSKVSNYEKKMRLHDIYSKTDSKSIQRMKSGQMFAREDLKRRKLVRDGPLSLKSTTLRTKDVQAVLLSDILVFLQEKDQKYVFASLDQKSTVISLKKLIVREVAHEEKGLFLISMVGKDPEMVEVHASSKEERNSWIQIIQDTINALNKDEDEGVPSESEEERRILDMKAKELTEQLHQKDQKIITLLGEKEKIFQSLTECSLHDDGSLSVTSRSFFKANSEDAPKGEPLIKSAVTEVETLQGLVNRNLWSSVGQQSPSPSEAECGVGPVSLPRRAETFGGFDSHQLNVSKGGEKDEGEDTQDLRRTESDSVLKKGMNTNVMFKRHSEALESVTKLHNMLSTLQAVVLQQDTYIEDQKLLLSERALTRTSSRPNSLIEQEKQRSMEKQRQDLANLKKQQTQHLEEKRKREREWEMKEKELGEREARLAQREELLSKGMQDIEKEKSELQVRKDEYQLDLERLRAAQKQLDKERDQLKKDMEKVSSHHERVSRIPSLSPGGEKWCKSGSSKQEHLVSELSVSPKKDSLIRTDSKQKGKGHFHLLGTNHTNKSPEGPTPSRLFSLSKTKEKKEKKKKGKGSRSPNTDSHCVEGVTPEEEIFC